jgi:CRP-like cAMP-binding protein
LLQSLSSEDWARLESGLEVVDLHVHTTLASPGERPGFVYFPESGIVSVVAIMEPGRQLEVGLYGRDGFSGAAQLLGADSSPHDHYTQTAVRALRIPTDQLLRHAADAPGLRSVLLRYVHVLVVQTAQTAAANGLYNIEQRLARWLLMVHDRLDGDDLAVTHETLGTMLGVRRSSVTVALHRLEGAKLVAGRRGRIVILDRPRLGALARSGYGAPESEYERLFEASLGSDSNRV